MADNVAEKKASGNQEEDVVVKEANGYAQQIKNYFRDKEYIGWYLYDFGITPFATSGGTAFFGPYLTLLAQEAADPSDGRIHSGSLSTDPASYYSYLTAASVILQLIFFVVLGPFGDFRNYRKRALMISGITTNVLIYLFIPISNPFWLTGVLFVITNLMLGLSTVYYNSFIPLLIRKHKAYTTLAGDEPETETIEESRKKDAEFKLDSLDPTPPAEKKKSGFVATEQQVILLKAKIANTISSYGSMFSYAGGVLVLLINVGVFAALPGSCRPLCKQCPDVCPPEECPPDWNPNTCDPFHWGYRINLGVIVGVWWTIFTIFPYLWLKVRRGEPFPEKVPIVTIGVRSMYHTLRRIRRVPQLFLFLAASLTYQDGVNAVATGASILAATELQMDGLEIGIAIILALFIGLIGNLFYLFLHYKVKFCTAKRIILWNLVSVVAVPIWGIFMKTKIEFYIAAVVYGTNSASLLAFSRSMVSSMTPRGMEAQVYSFYEITDKGTSWMAPLVMSIVTDATGDIRKGFLTIIFFAVVGGIILLFVDQKKGETEAELYTNGESLPEIPLETDSEKPNNE